MTKKTLILSLIIVVLAITGTALAYFELRPEIGQNTNTNVITNSPKADEESGEIDTSEWKTYRNEEYGFEFRYPGDYLIKQIDNGVYLKHPTYDLVPTVTADGGAISIALTTQEVEDLIEEIENADPPLSKVVSEKEYTLGGVKGVEVVGNFALGIEVYHIFVTYNNKNYLISYSGIGLNYVKEILPTFKFTD